MFLSSSKVSALDLKTEIYSRLQSDHTLLSWNHPINVEVTGDKENVNKKVSY